jgi:Protein of unknown function (DUF1549)/Protein of unknown function (DUF1553)/Planctomycete cytochrome C
MPQPRFRIGIVAILVATVTHIGWSQDQLSREQQRFFEAKIRPVLVQHCYECHSAKSDDIGGKLLVDTRNGIRQGGESGPAVVPGKPASSLLLIAMKHDDPKLIMPPADYGAKLPAAVIADFETWIRGGAPDPRAGKGKVDSISEEARQWWAWQPLKKVSVPNVTAIGSVSEQAKQAADPSWPKNDIDRFIFAGLAEPKLTPSPDTDRLSLVRRIAFDLTGLPPTAEELKRYGSASPPAPIEELVDHYLASDQYGERMARRWLDVARYAESSGKDVNVAFPHAWRYRDYVVDAFIKDMPYDQFIREQIAGDLIKTKNKEDAARQLIATGFLAMGPKGLGEQNPRQFAVDVADEQIDAVSQAFLAVTIACARCHDHKFDPVSQRDYTAMAGIFLSTETHYGTAGAVGGRNRSTNLELPNELSVPQAEPELTAQQVKQLRARHEELDKQRKEILAERMQQRRDGKDSAPPPNFVQIQTQLNLLETKLESIREDGSFKALAMGVKDKPPASNAGRDMPRFARAVPQGLRRGGPQMMGIIDSPQLIRGEIDKPGDIVPRGLPEFLAGSTKVKINPDQSGRLQLANWIASSKNPLTARVMVNRVWLWMFGQGLVKSVDNFGTTGDLPSNQALLDYLAQDFMQHKWSVKKLVRDMVLSRTYAQSSDHIEDAFLIDPENELLWRANRRPLEAECLRDGLFATSGSLKPERPHGSLISRAGDGPIGQRRVTGIAEEQITSANDPHRSIYLPVPRNVLPDALELFDFADNSMVNGMRSTTIVPSQALYWMNNSSVEKECRLIADEILGRASSRSDSEGLAKGRLAKSPPLDDKRIVELFDQLTMKILSRTALEDEARATVDYVKHKQQDGTSHQTIWAAVARSLFASSDYRFLK